MNRKSKLSVVFVIVVLLTLAAALSVQAQPQPIPTPIVISPQPQAQADVVAEPETQEAQTAAIDYWTRERMLDAQPVVLLVDPSAPAVDAAAADADAAAAEMTGEPGFTLGGRPSPTADVEAREAYPDEWAALDEAALEAAALDVILADEAATLGPDSPTGSSQVFTRYAGNQNWAFYQNVPYRMVGKLFSSAGSCTASSASPNNIIVTAAHCVYNTGNNTWYANKVFAPAYRNGVSPYGTFPTSQCFVLNAWVNLSGGYSINGWAKHDVAVCRMRTNSAGQSLSSAVGWLGRSWNWGYVQNHHAFGYASNITSQYTSICTAETFYQTTDTYGMGCDMTYGASGGPSLRVHAPFQIGANNYVNSVQSGIYVGTKNIYGARFSSNNIVPLCTAAGC